MEKIDIQILAQSADKIAKQILELHFKHHPESIECYGAAGKDRCYEDAVFHLKFLAEAITMELPDMYANYILWAASMLDSRNIPESVLYNDIDYVQKSIKEVLGSQYTTLTEPYIQAAKEKLSNRKAENNSYINESNPLKNEVSNYLDYLLNGKRQLANTLVNELIQNGVSIKNIYQDIFQVSQYEVGRLWQCNKITVAHEHYCTAATQQIMSGLYQYIFNMDRNGKTLVACSISGELHEMGIRMVADYFEMEGWDTYYLGTNLPEKQIETYLIEYKADILALSVTLPLHVSKAAALIKSIKTNPSTQHVKIMVGGYPFINNPELWQRVSADGFAQNAEQAILKANELIYN